jgi:hypothetical protein
VIFSSHGVSNGAVPLWKYSYVANDLIINGWTQISSINNMHEGVPMDTMSRSSHSGVTLW